MSVQIIDLFCGIGGLTRGLINSGLDVIAGFDIDSTCKYTYEHNNKVKYYIQNIRNLKGDVLNKLYSTDSFKILVGCAPCQPFSKMRFKFGKANFHDEKYNLLLEYGRLIQESHPVVIAMENVPQIQNTRVFAKFLKILVSDGYKINYKVLYCPDYGIPQTRRRFVLVGSTLGTIDIIPPTHNRASIHVRNFINVEIKGWVGTYKSTRGRKAEMADFPDNFISLYANHKMGEFNILPIVGQNKLSEVYVVGQLHIDIFELTELPDMALSNRQGYKTDDLRYQAVLEYVRNILLPDILKMRDVFVSLGKKKKEEEKLEQQRQNEASFKKSVDRFRKNTAKKAATKISDRLGISTEKLEEVENILSEEINSNSPDMGIKSIIDSQKKKILISQTYKDKDLADIVYNMLVFNNVPPEDIIYTNCDNEISRIPEGDVGKSGIYDYLRDFFVDSYSTQKMYVIFVTSKNTKESWGALTEVGAAWITQIEHKIFNIHDFRPEHPLDDAQQWHTSFRDNDGNLFMSRSSADFFAQRIEFICDKLGYVKKTRQDNAKYLEKLVLIKDKSI